MEAKFLMQYVSADARERLADVDNGDEQGRQHTLALAHIADLAGVSGIKTGGVFDELEDQGVAEWVSAVCESFDRELPDDLFNAICGMVMLATDRGVIVGLGAAHHAARRDDERMARLQERYDTLATEGRKLMAAYDRAPDGPARSTARERMNRNAERRALVEREMSQLADRYITADDHDNRVGA